MKRVGFSIFPCCIISLCCILYSTPSIDILLCSKDWKSTEYKSSFLKEPHKSSMLLTKPSIKFLWCKFIKCKANVSYCLITLETLLLTSFITEKNKSPTKNFSIYALNIGNAPISLNVSPSIITPARSVDFIFPYVNFLAE